MNKSTKRLLGSLALGAAAAGAIGAVIMRRDSKPGRRQRERAKLLDKWARPGMKVTFRAEVMPGREPAERTYEVQNLLPSGRVLLTGVTGEHAQKEFEPVR